MSRLAPSALWAVCGALCACAPPPPGLRSEYEPRPSPTATASSAPRLRVQLAEASAQAFVVEDTTLGTVRVAAAPGGVRLDDAPASARVRLDPRDAERGLAVGGRRHRATLTVQPARGAGLDAFLEIELEDYVAGVVAAELTLWSALPAELEAQAVAARSYALAQRDLGRPFLFDDTRDQAYRGVFETHGNAALAARAGALRAALEATRGLVLRVDGAILDARFHAACGGHTANGRDVFPEHPSAAPLRSVPCAPCAESGALEWRLTVGPDALAALAARRGLGTAITRFEPVAVDAHGRWLRARFHGTRGAATIDLADLRNDLGAAAFASNRVESTWPRPDAAVRAGILFVGRGRGHGVGLCQTGARGYARRGLDARAILAHYYPGAVLGAL